MKIRSLLIIIATILTASISFADVTTLGSGFKCDGSSILKSGRLVTYSKAKSTMVQTIAKLKKKLNAAPKSKKAAIKAKIKAASQTKTLLASCSQGKLNSDQVDPIFTTLASGSGTYTGTYNGTVTFFGFIQPISGTVTAQFVLEQTNLSAILTLGGNLGSALNAQPLSFLNQDVGGIGFPAQFFLSNTFIGDLTLSFTQAGHISIINSNYTTGPVDFEGDLANQTINSSLNGSYNGSTFSGTAALVKQP